MRRSRGEAPQPPPLFSNTKQYLDNLVFLSRTLEPGVLTGIVAKWIAEELSLDERNEEMDKLLRGVNVE